MSTSPEDIWKKIAPSLPALNKEEQQKAEQQWLLRKLQEDELSHKEEAVVTIKSIFDDAFYQETQQILPAANAAFKPIQRALWPQWASAAAAVLLLAFGLHWASDETNSYATAMEASRQQPIEAVAYLGVTYEIFSDLETLENQLPDLAEEGQGIAIPEQVAVVSGLGEANGVAFFEITQEGQNIRVLTDKPLPQKGEMVSFNAKAIKASHFGREIVLLVEVTRHEVF